MPTGIVAFAALNDPDVDALLAAQATHPRVRGIRHIVNWHADPQRTYGPVDLTVDPQWQAGYALLAKYGLSFDLQCYPGQMQGLVPLIERHPDIPVIGFPKGAGEKLPAYARETGVQAVGVDETLDPQWVARELPAGMPVQGNFDPLLLLSGSDRLESRARFILEAFADRPHIFNLGHGIDRRTPIAHVERLIETVRSFEG